MAIVTEGRRDVDFIVSEANNFRSRDEVIVTIPANATIDAGTIMAVITATGKYVPHDEDGTDNGTRAPRAVLYAGVTNSTGAPVDVSATMIVRDAEVNGAHLTHDPARTSDADKANDLADLAAFGIIAR